MRLSTFKIIAHLATASYLVACSGGNFSGGPNLQPNKKGAEHTPTPTAPPTGTPGEIPNQPATPNAPLGGGGASLTQITFNAGLKFDGVNDLSINLTSGVVNFRSGGKYPLRILPLIVNGQRFDIQSGSQASIAGWTAQNPGCVKYVGLGLQDITYSEPARRAGKPPSMRVNIGADNVFSLHVDDDVNERPGSVSFNNFALLLNQCQQ